MDGNFNILEWFSSIETPHYCFTNEFTHYVPYIHPTLSTTLFFFKTSVSLSVSSPSVICLTQQYLFHSSLYLDSTSYWFYTWYSLSLNIITFSIWLVPIREFTRTFRMQIHSSHAPHPGPKVYRGHEVHLRPWRHNVLRCYNLTKLILYLSDFCAIDSVCFGDAPQPRLHQIHKM